jgi:murein DD-endopeptidase MepM/ murein hydrolase activator NlpD
MRSPFRVVALALIAVVSLGAMSIWQPREPEADPSVAPQVSALYAAPVERVETHVLERGQTLSNVLARAAISGQEMAELLFGLRQHLNPRRLTDGVEITVRRWVDNDAPRAIEVRMNADSTLRLTRADLGWAGVVMVTPTVLDTMFTAGTIDRGKTLYEALVYDVSSDLPASERVQLVYELAEIYEFKLDFTREIQPGDAFRVVYEREARPDGTARSRRVIAAEVVNAGRRYQAVHYAQGDLDSYFDEDGKSLRTGFSRYPVPYRITSSFNPRRYHPVLGIYRAHLGTDFGAPKGSQAFATADGTVVFAGTSGGYGNLVKVRHMSGYETRYAHLSRFAAGIRSGARVKQGEVVGYVGATGLATAPHLHYELRKDGRAIDVRTARLPDAPPIPKEYRSGFDIAARSRLALLEAATERYLAARAQLPGSVGQGL